jgi:hypothetical protein
VFAAGFLMRALGSLVFGHIGDTPMAAVHMIRHSGYDLAPAILIMATAAISTRRYEPAALRRLARVRSHDPVAPALAVLASTMIGRPPQLRAAPRMKSTC